MSYKPEVFVSGQWGQNGLAFVTEAEALASARDLMGRWFLVTDCRAVESDEQVNYRLIDGQLVSV